MKENITKIESKRDNVRTLLNELDEKLETQENAYQAINTSVLNHFNEGNIPNVEIIKYVDEKDKENKYSIYRCQNVETATGENAILFFD
jgi:hypothetical protein